MPVKKKKRRLTIDDRLYAEHRRSLVLGVCCALLRRKPIDIFFNRYHDRIFHVSGSSGVIISRRVESALILLGDRAAEKERFWRLLANADA